MELKQTLLEEFPSGATQKHISNTMSALNAVHLAQYLDRFFNHWKKKAPWSKCDAIEVSVGALKESQERILSQSFHLWLLSYQLTQTTLIFTSRKSLIVLSSRQKIKLFENVRKKLEKSHVLNSLHLIEKNKENESEGYEKLIEACTAQKVSSIGIIKSEKDIKDGDYLEGWYNVLEREKFSLQDATPGFQSLFAIKSIEETECIRYASKAASKLLSSFLRPRIEEIIDEGSSINHHILAKETETALVENPQKLENFPQEIVPELLDVPFTPLIQSGGIYNISQGVESDEHHLHFGTIVNLLGVQYKNYNAVIGRTYMIDPTPTQEKYYKALQEMRQVALKNIKPNAPCSGVYIAVLNYLEKNYPDLVEYLPPMVGHGIGLLSQESYTRLSEDNHTPIKAGMAFVVQVALMNIRETAPKYASNRQRKVYSLLLADTCLAEPSALKILTKAEYKDVSYSLEEEESEDDITAGIDSRNIIERKTRSSVLLTVGEDKRREQLEQIILKKRREYALNGGRSYTDDDTSKKPTVQTYDKLLAKGKISSYPAPERIPRNILKKNRIVVDAERATLLVPINGTHIPFHIASIKTVSTSDELNYVYLRINFNTQTVHFGKRYEPAIQYPDSTFIKEISFRSKDGKNINHVVRVIKDVRKRLKQMEREKQQRSTLVKQEKLRIIRGAYIPRIRDICIRPNPKGKKTSGVLEAHVNGLRFIGEKGSRVYINYSNVKHAFFQKAERDTIVLIHFHLVDGIMVGKRQQKDIQFYTEVMEEYDHLTGRGQRHQTDQESIREERRQILLKEKLNKEFREFAKKVEEKSEQNGTQIEFETPYRDLEFIGTPHRSSVKLCPTVNCLVNLTEYPFFVLSLDDVECACFERVRFGLRAFDLVFVMKDYNKGVRMITAVPMKKLELLKDWLLQVEIVYFEVSFSFKWEGILENIKHDPSWKPWEEDGWKELLNTENMENEEEQEDEGAVVDEWKPDPEEEEYDEDEYEAPDLHLVDEDSEEEAMEDDSEEEGKTWDELQAEAIRADERKRKRDEAAIGFGGGMKRRRF